MGVLKIDVALPCAVVPGVSQDCVTAAAFVKDANVKKGIQTAFATKLCSSMSKSFSSTSINCYKADWITLKLSVAPSGNRRLGHVGHTISASIHVGYTIRVPSANTGQCGSKKHPCTDVTNLVMAIVDYAEWGSALTAAISKETSQTYPITVTVEKTSSTAAARADVVTSSAGAALPQFAAVGLAVLVGLLAVLE